MLVEGVDGVVSVVDGEGLVAEAAQHFDGDHLVDGVVFGDEDAQGGRVGCVVGGVLWVGALELCGEGEGAAVAGGALDGDLAVHHGDDLLADGEAES